MLKQFKLMCLDETQNGEEYLLFPIKTPLTDDQLVELMSVLGTSEIDRMIRYGESEMYERTGLRSDQRARRLRRGR